MIRQHQFHKVEMVVICTPEQAEAQHARIVGQAEKLLQLFRATLSKSITVFP